MDVSNNKLYPNQTKNVENTGKISLMRLSKVSFNIQIFGKHICSFTWVEIFYTEFYFKVEAMFKIQGKLSFRLLNKVWFSVYSLSSDSITWRSSIQNLISIGQETWKLLVDIHVFHKVWLSQHKFLQNSHLLNNFHKTIYTKFHRLRTDVWTSSHMTYIYILNKECLMLEREDTA